jgi:hypothetical protein
LKTLLTVVEKRAAFACTPELFRPSMHIHDRVVACGDYIAGPYPSTLEAAVRSGIQVIDFLDEKGFVSDLYMLDGQIRYTVTHRGVGSVQDLRLKT